MLKELALKHKPNKKPYELAIYLDAYERHFIDRQLLPNTILEIGVNNGNSLNMWSEYFVNSLIVGIDIKKKDFKFVSDRIHFEQCSQSDTAALDKVLAKYGGAWDIIIDDGSHRMKDQRKSFRFLFPTLKQGGIYVIEDVWTSYWPEFGGGGNKTTIDMIKNMIDKINVSAHVGNSRAKKKNESRLLDEIELKIKSLHCYPSICFLESN